MAQTHPIIHKHAMIICAADLNATSVVHCQMPIDIVHGAIPIFHIVGLCLQWGRTSNAASEDVKEGVLLRSGAVTHSTHFDQRMVILTTVSKSPTISHNVGGQNQRSGTFTVQMPPNAVIAPPGLYMLFLIGADKTPSPALYVTLGVPVPSSGPQPPQDSGEGPTMRYFISLIA